MEQEMLIPVFRDTTIAMGSERQIIINDIHTTYDLMSKGYAP